MHKAKHWSQDRRRCLDLRSMFARGLVELDSTVRVGVYDRSVILNMRTRFLASELVIDTP
jgi:hypothetical protein